MKVTYIDHMGSDLMVANAARVSFKKFNHSLTEADKGLIQFLARGCSKKDWDEALRELIDEGYYCHIEQGGWIAEIERMVTDLKRMPTHWTPFANGGTVLLHIKAPIFVARQLFKHQAGFEPPNEVSRRYVTDEPEFYWPNWRAKAENVKQGSGDELSEDTQQAVFFDVERVTEAARIAYHNLIEVDGVCPEQARMVLPQSMYTEWYWKGNLYAWASLYNTRTEANTQKETQEVARRIGKIIKPLYPYSWAALTGETV